MESVCTELQDQFRAFVDTGETHPTLIEHIEECGECLAAIEAIVDRQKAAFQAFITLLGEGQMKKYILYPRRHARTILAGTTPEQLEKQKAAALRDWRRNLILKLRLKFPQATVDGFRHDNGIAVSLMTEAPMFLELLQRELDCVCQLDPEPSPPTELVYPFTRTR